MQDISFASENYMGAHDAFLQAIQKANEKPAPSYGNDMFTGRAVQIITSHFPDAREVLFAFNGTGANNLALSCITKPYSSVLCSDVAHIYVDEGTAPEAFLQCRLYPVASKNGKILIEELEKKLTRIGDLHHPQPSAISLSQPTEYGTIYTKEELLAVYALARRFKLKVHIDGARFFNAVAATKMSLSEMVEGADVLTLGGTKNGMLFGEAVIFFQPVAGSRFQLKRSMQLASKMRYISAQFEAMFRDDLWLTLASRSNCLATAFSSNVPLNLEVLYPVQTNAVFLKMSATQYQQLQEKAAFYLWNESTQEVRFMFSFNNTSEEVRSFTNYLHEIKKS